jgi:hypothetical protein
LEKGKNCFHELIKEDSSSVGDMLQRLNCHSLEDKHRFVMMYKITNENYITEKDKLKPSLGSIPTV